MKVKHCFTYSTTFFSYSLPQFSVYKCIDCNLKYSILKDTLQKWMIKVCLAVLATFIFEYYGIIKNTGFVCVYKVSSTSL